MRDGKLHLFEAIGVELEYMIVDRDTLRVRPVADRVLRDDAGEVTSELEVGSIAWSNELCLHVIELKTNGPAPGLPGLDAEFQASVERINRILAHENAMLMPSAMHPLMDPHAEMRLWPHEYGPVYHAFHRIFDCRGHGWANLQSVHLNLPFCGDDEFGRLHAAVRFALPLLPALSASSPLVEGQRGPALDSRLEFYRQNARRVPSVSGSVVPEPVFTRETYERDLLGRIYSDLAPLDPEGILRHEWVNARGCIARFDRDAIEIRVLDITESPRSDLAIAEVIVALVRALVEERILSGAQQRSWPTDALASILRAVIRDAEQAPISDARLLEALHWKGAVPCSAGELWLHLLDRLLESGLRPESHARVSRLLEHGCLARRILARVGSQPTRERIEEVYRELCTCLAQGTLFGVDS